jgi:polyisoprenoid-binding protein YceI
MHSKRLAVVSSVLAAAVSLSLAAHAKLSKVDTSTASFHATGPVGMGIDGSTSETTVADDGTKVTVTVPLGKLTTGIELRDKHMKESLGVDTYPDASLEVTRSSLKFPSGDKEVSEDTKGTFKLHGKSKEVTFHYTARQDGGKYAVTGTAKINMTDYGITAPSYLGVSVKPEVDVKVSFKAKDG